MAAQTDFTGQQKKILEAEREATLSPIDELRAETATFVNAILDRVEALESEVRELRNARV